jgi:hypothetical protein
MTMGIDSAGRAAREDDPLASTKRDDHDKSADRAARTQADTNDDRGHQRAETRTREEYAAARRADHSAADADRTATSDRADENEPVSSGERPAGDQPGDRRAGADQAAISARDLQEAGLLPETITFENKDIEVTHNAADGIWIEGLPGEPPARIGDLVPSAEDPAQGRGEKLRKELNKEAEDISDTAGKWADHVQEILDNPRPTHSLTHNRPPETAISGAEHGINAGQGAEAVVMLAIVGAAAVHKLRERWERAWEH